MNSLYILSMFKKKQKRHERWKALERTSILDTCETNSLISHLFGTSHTRFLYSGAHTNAAQQFRLVDFSSYSRTASLSLAYGLTHAHTCTRIHAFWSVKIVWPSIRTVRTGRVKRLYVDGRKTMWRRKREQQCWQFRLSRQCTLCVCELNMRAPFWLSLFQTIYHSNEAILWFYRRTDTNCTLLVFTDWNCTVPTDTYSPSRQNEDTEEEK